ncbi:MAG: acyl carrier protein [Kiritimatiellia bacterium]|jgi:acyl carrier protein
MSRAPADLNADVFSTVCRCFCDALELEPDEITFDSKIIDDLGAESLDLLDVVFRLERSFDIQIPRGGLESQAADVDGEPGEVDGLLTAAGAHRLREVMPEVPPEEIFAGMRVDELAGTFRTGTFYYMVQRLLVAQSS